MEEKSKDYQKKYRKKNKQKIKKYREEHKEYFKRKNIEWNKKNPNYNKDWREKNRIDIRRKRREWTKGNEGRVVEYTKNWRKKNPEKLKVNSNGNKKYPIKNKCEWCGSTYRLQRHHPDYSRPEYVITLCAYCHTKTYNNEKGGKTKCLVANQKTKKKKQ